MQSRQLLFYTGATKFFHNYIPLYFLFGALANPGASFEFLVRDIPRMQALHGQSLDRIASVFDCVYYLHDVATRACRKTPLMENSYRFLLQPFLKAEYVNVGEIDILLTENILARHQAYVDSQLPFYNQIRPVYKRLTGLHLARYVDMYPLEEGLWDYCELKDEEILYKDYELKGRLFSEGLDALKVKLGRTNCGVHMSPNLLPFSVDLEVPGWGINADYLRKMMSYLSREPMRSIVELMYVGSRRVLTNLVTISLGLEAMSESDQLLYGLKKREIWGDF